ncbi:hypothetical protein NEF87_002766 [Candidatus Lokiarchaeum ossiferum]|uniref:Uncharacterized protein n=1 Tax=Candidatus Lokiarchaeum ossiferum TaxID=2951803 RepID=A0ABY6HSJ6_9ARCH|nr:hypothetical protein NEF87_002766 [Candidatus Lokiarchaeum sp. B-35]
MTPKRVKAGAGPFSFEWENWMKDDNADIKRIKRIVDSWIIAIDMGGASITDAEMTSFFKIMRSYGHLVKLKDDKDYLEKYKKLNDYYKENFEFGAITVRRRR